MLSDQDHLGLKPPKKKPLTGKEKAVCRALKNAWDERAKELGLTQDVAAERLGVSQGAISHLFAERNAVHTDAVIQFAAMLRIPIQAINPELASLIYSIPHPHNSAPQDNAELSTEQKQMAERLRDLWHQKSGGGLTQSQAAERLGYANQETVARYLTGVMALDADAVLKFSRLLGVQPGQIDPNLRDVSLLHADAMDYLIDLLDEVFSATGDLREQHFRHVESLLRERGLRNVDLANYFGVSSTAVGKWFAERKIPSDRFIKLPKLLNCTILDLALPAPHDSESQELASYPKGGRQDTAAQYSSRSLLSALDKVVGRGVRAEIGIFNSLEEAATRLLLEDSWSDGTREIIRAALRNVREFGELCFDTSVEERSKTRRSE